MSDVRKPAPWWVPEPKEIIAYMIVGLFAAVTLRNMDDNLIKGALIGAFSTAVGFYLGNSKSAVDAGKRADNAVTALAAVPKQDG